MLFVIGLRFAALEKGNYVIPDPSYEYWTGTLDNLGMEKNKSCASMEVNSGKSRLFRSKSAMLKLLHEQQQSGLSIQTFCTQRSIASGSFHNWKKNYGAGDGL